MILDDSIQDLGGNCLTPMSDIIWFQHDPDFDELEDGYLSYIATQRAQCSCQAPTTSVQVFQ